MGSLRVGQAHGRGKGGKANSKGLSPNFWIHLNVFGLPKKTCHAKGLCIEVCLRSKRRAQLLKVVCWDFHCFAVRNRDVASQIVTVPWYHVRCRSCDASSSYAGDEFGSWAACPEDLSAFFCVQIQKSRRFDWNQVGLNNGKIWKIRENPVVCEHKARHKALESVPGAKHCRQSISHQQSINGPRPKPCHSQGCEWQAFAVLWNEIKGKCLTYKTYIYICGSEGANMKICSCMFSNSLMISNKTEDWTFIDVQRSKVEVLWT